MRYLLWTICLSLLLVASELFSRPLLPVDETRYMSVAWEAHVRGDHLVSHLNSETYAHKPPLLFWLINAVWSVAGLNEYAARLVAPAAGIACILLTALMARRLWPESAAFNRCVPMMLASMSLWIVFCPVTMFDTLLTCFTLLALLGVLRAESGAAVTGWLIAGVARGTGSTLEGAGDPCACDASGPHCAVVVDPRAIELCAMVYWLRICGRHWRRDRAGLGTSVCCCRRQGLRRRTALRADDRPDGQLIFASSAVLVVSALAAAVSGAVDFTSVLSGAGCGLQSLTRL